MSSELQALLKRMQPPTPKYKQVNPEPSPYLTALVRRMEARQWRNETLLLTIEYIKESAGEIKFIRHLRTCHECQMEASLSVERYGGRCLPWFLDLINDVNECYDTEDPRWKDCPRVENYRIGSYWDKSTDPDETMKFILDRLSWAEKLIRQQIMMSTQFYKRLKIWNLSGEPPSEETLPFL